MNQLEDKVECFLCQEDITNKVKVISYHCFPDKLWDEATKNWAENFTKLFNGCLCSKCAEKDLDAASKRNKWENEENISKLEKTHLKELSKFHKLFGRFYIKI